MNKITLRDLKAMKAKGEPLACCTAYDYAGIQLAEEAEMDILVPSDWGIGTTLFGHQTPISVTMENVLFYLKALALSVKRGFILAPMPFGSYQISNEDAVRNATGLMKGGADAVKLEGGGQTIDRVRALAEVGIPCVGHLGYTPQSIKNLGPERVVGDTAEEAAQLIQDARQLDESGAWAAVLQNVPERVARVVTEKTKLITIAAGGTRGCDGTLAPSHDLLGWPQSVKPLYSVQYANFFDRALAALNRHCEEVQALEFPTEKHTFKITDEEFETFLDEIGKE